MIKIAFGSVPKDGGTFTFYRNQRPALLDYGIDLRCVTVGQREARLLEPGYVDEGCVLLAPNVRSVKRQARVFVDWCEAEAIDIVLGINSVAILSAIPHLPERVRVMARCANGFDHGYRITLAGRERLAAIVALTPRLRDTLIAEYDAPADRLWLIPNGIDPAPLEIAASRRRGQGQRIELGFLGRLEHAQKGVLHLPGIVQALAAEQVPFRLRIAGKGRHEAELRAGLADALAAGTVEMIGALGSEAVLGFLAEIDALLFTSHFEGCPNALLEAMMAGAVPVSSLIEGTTDFLIEAGETGFLCAVDDAACFARQVALLERDRECLARMSRAVAEAARAQFSNATASAAYAGLFQKVMADPPPAASSRPWRQFRVDPNFAVSWGGRLRRMGSTLRAMVRG
jgi:glycosyltransferase involved in cell wall biosynthesis